MTGQHEQIDVAIVGSGVIGTAAAATLAQQGRTVLVLEAQSELGPGASTFNAGLLTPSHAGPWGTRRDVATSAKWMLRHDSPFGVSPRPELVRFFASLLTQSKASLATCLRVTRQMCMTSVNMHEELSTTADTGFRRDGLLDSYRTDAAFLRAKEAAKLHADDGVPCRVVSAEEARELEPALAPGRSGAVLFAREAHLDPAAYLRSVAAIAERHGAVYRFGTHVIGVRRSGQEFILSTTSGEVRAAELVIAAGAATSRLALGARLPIEPGTGYAIDLDSNQHVRLQRPLLLQEERVAVNPLAQGIRLAGTMTFSGRAAALDQRRVHGIVAAGRVGLLGLTQSAQVRVGMGGRPCTPDGLPVVGRLRDSGAIVASGHAMLGLTMAPLAATQISAIVHGEDFEFSDVLTPARFGRS
ncbi:MAG TPA: FAD-dependent oxidoreductase [Actinokineospora sp.]|nr:FAD-dependent oxidoreductase [Actinokineospora sp.]